MYILVVDDEESILQVMSDFLKDCDHEVVCAGDGIQALDMLKEWEQIELVISDIRMPKLDGIRLLETVRVRFPGVPVILMTGHGDESVAIAALEQGAQYYLKKPIKFAQLIKYIEQIETRQRLESQVMEDYQDHFTGKAGGPVEEEIGTEQGATAPFMEKTAHFLVVDAQEEERQTVTIVLEEMGCRVQAVSSAEEALECFAAGTFEVVITEVELPDLDGIEMIRRMRASDPTLVPLILTAREDQATAVAALESGARGFLRKPFEVEDLQARAGQAVQERRQLADTRLLLGDLIQVRTDLRQKVVERERYLRQLIDAAPFAVLSTDSKGQVLTFNKKAEEVYRYSEEEMLGKPFTLLAEKEITDLEACSEGESGPKKDYHVRKDQERVPVLTRRHSVLDDRERPVACLYVIEDLTQREQMETQLFYAERLSLLGQLAPRIAHEFKTPMQMIMSYAELALNELEKGDITKIEEYIQVILPSVERMIGLVEQMANLGKPSESREESIDLGADLQGIIADLRPLCVVKYCDLSIDAAADLPMIYGDPGQIEQVFRNLIVNAAQAMEKSKEKQLRISLQPSADSQRIEVRVMDTGPGIAPENMDEIFQPFFTTKANDSNKGTGLGLPIVKTILDRHQASIDVESEVGKGTCFALSFPALQQQP
jgi:PAS domain S-box-containing protein